MSPKDQGVLERAHVEAELDAELRAKIASHEEILKGDGKHQPGLVKRTQDVEDYVKEEKVTRRILVTLFGMLFAVVGSASAWAVNKLADAVLSRPIVVTSPAVPR